MKGPIPLLKEVLDRLFPEENSRNIEQNDAKMNLLGRRIRIDTRTGASLQATGVYSTTITGILEEYLNSRLVWVRICFPPIVSGGYRIPDAGGQAVASYHIDSVVYWVEKGEFTVEIPNFAMYAQVWLWPEPESKRAARELAGSRD